MKKIKCTKTEGQEGKSGSSSLTGHHCTHTGCSTGEDISELWHCSLQGYKATYSPSQETCNQLTSLLSHHNPNSQAGGMADPKYIRDYKYHGWNSIQIPTAPCPKLRLKNNPSWALHVPKEISHSN